MIVYSPKKKPQKTRGLIHVNTVYITVFMCNLSKFITYILKTKILRVYSNIHKLHVFCKIPCSMQMNDTFILNIIENFIKKIFFLLNIINIYLKAFSHNNVI